MKVAVIRNSVLDSHLLPRTEEEPSFACNTISFLKQNRFLDKEKSMFGTTGYLVAKEGREDDLRSFVEKFGNSPNIVSIFLYKVNSDKNDFVEWIFWVDKNAHDENSSQPDFPAVYASFLEMLAEDPVWYSGEMIYESTSTKQSPAGPSP
jgi:hypothetical protein